MPRIGMYNTPEGTTEKFIELKPTWVGLMPALFAALENGSPEGKKIAREELMRLAKAVDVANAATKEAS